ncbi:MAG TPA: CpsB/CapC family capsule biosynthesis tyrosine phosphatase [Polyangiales bacterium]|nr:CpsB/CapC family capsule biosynthesis tyrosine phosphatase [Polyangiales bacterium]
MSLSGLCDLHCHYVPGVDDGVHTIEEGQKLCQALRAIGYATVVATPHIRMGMFENNKAALLATFEQFVAAVSGDDAMPETGLAAEHFCDETFFELLDQGNALPYPGGHAALVEFPPETIPLKIEDRFFRMQVRGLRPVIAHPERYMPIWKSADPLEKLVDHGALALLDLMSLTGKYGRRPQRAAEDLLEIGLYYAACSDSHKPQDVELVARGIERLVGLIGEGEAELLLAEHPRSILDGTVQD